MWMAEARDRAAWSRTFAQIAALYNAFRGKNQPAVNVLQFFPWDKVSKQRAEPMTLALDNVLKELFPEKR
ncbi:MAG: hypothetical protein DDT37_01639 [Firmicutes bacterium]|nr:hypothetical protein [candidate division NPL-UPA2 bacterium]